MEDNVKYQLERAEDALRTALNLGSAKEDPYLLRNIAETLSTISGWKRSFSSSSPRYNIPSKSFNLNSVTNKTSIPNITIQTTPDATPNYYPTMGVGGSTDSTGVISFTNIPTRF